MDYAQSRFNMVEGQIKTNRVTDPYVIEAMGEVPREIFVPTSRKNIAYIDDAIEVANGRYMVEPMVLARMLEAAQITEKDIVLDVGCNTGYSSAVLSKIASTVVALESDETLANGATKTLNEYGADNVLVVTGQLSNGYEKQGPYDVILVNGCVEFIPQALKDQLADGGRLVLAENPKSTMSTISLYTKQGEIFSKRDVFEAGVAMLNEFVVPKGFKF